MDRIGNPFDSGYDVIYQMPFIHGGVRGIADFLIRVQNPDPGSCTYEPIDAKLARTEAKPGHVLQLCFYADALEEATGLPPKHLHIWLGSDRVESLLAEEFHPYWNRLRTQLTPLLDDSSVEAETVPEQCPHCDFCEFRDLCTSEWRNTDSLIYVAGIRGADRTGLEASGAETLGQLALRTRPVDPIQPQRLRHLIDQASLQAQARADPEAMEGVSRVVSSCVGPDQGPWACLGHRPVTICPVSSTQYQRRLL